MLTDGIVTLLGQEKSYWKNYKSTKEASPAYFVMVIHPTLFILASIIWFIGLYWIFPKIPYPINLIVACGFIAANSWGSAGWTGYMLGKKKVYTPDNRLSILLYWSILVLYFFLIGILATIFLSVYFQKLYQSSI